MPQGEQVEAWLEKRTLADLAVLNQSLTKTVYLTGSRPTIADVCCCAYLYWPNQAGIAGHRVNPQDFSSSRPCQ